MACRTSRYDAKVPSRSARRVSWMLADPEQQLLAVVRRPACARSRRSASTTPAQSWRASETRTSARSARSFAGSASSTAVQVAAAAARSRDPLLLELRDLEQQAHPLRDVGGAIGAGVQQLRQIGPGLGLGEDLLERGVGLLVVAELGQDLLGGAPRVLRLEQPGRGDAQRPAQQPEPLLGVGRRGGARVVETGRARPTRRPRRRAARGRCAPPRSWAPPRTRARTTGTPAPSSRGAARRSGAPR